METQTETNMTPEQIAYRILDALCDSHWSHEMQEYHDAVQEDLRLTDEQMTKFFSLPTMVNLLRPIAQPDKLYKGRPIKKVSHRWNREPFVSLSNSRALAGWQPVEQVAEQQVEQVAEQQVEQPAEQVEQVEQPVEQVEETQPEQPQQEEVGKGHEPEPEQQPEQQPEFKSDDDACIDAFASVCRASNIPFEQFECEASKKYPKALFVRGDGIQAYNRVLVSLGGTWNQKHTAYVFNKIKIIQARETARQIEEAGIHSQDE